MAIPRLSEEIVVHIFSFLPTSDRLNCALTCRRWAQASGAPALIRNTWLHVKGSDMEEAEVVANEGFRQFRNLRLSEASFFHFNPAFWSRVGPSLRKLEFIECFWSPDVYYNILQACPNLESLAICSSKQLLSRLNFEMPSWPVLRRTKQAMRNVRHLHLNFILNADMLWLLLVPMINVKTIALSCFDWGSDFVSRLAGILGEHREITTLDLEPGFQRRHGCEKLLEICAPSVRELRIRKNSLPLGVYEAMAGCTKLRHLLLKLNNREMNSAVQRTLENAPELETLDIAYENSPFTIPKDVLAPILELTKLRELSLHWGLRRNSGRFEVVEFLHDLGRVSTLEHLSLDMDGCVVTETAFRSLTTLPNLRKVDFQNICWNDESLKMFSSPKHLETLRIRRHRNKDDLDGPELKCPMALCMMGFGSPNALETMPESSSLKSLMLENDALTDSDLEYVAAHHDRLRALTIWNCYSITEAGLTNLLQREPLLEELDVRRQETTQPELFKAIEELCPLLRYLRLNHLSEVSRSVAELFSLQRPTVTVEYNAPVIVQNDCTLSIFCDSI